MDSHEREAAGAAAGMADVYGFRPGSTVHFRRPDWEPGVTAPGLYIETTSSGLAVIESDGEWFAVLPEDLMPF